MEILKKLPLPIFLAAALLAAVGAPARAAGVVTLIPDGAVDVRSGPTESWRPVSGTETVAAGQEVRTHRTSTAQLLFSDGSRILINNFSIFRIDKTGTDETSFMLKLGKIRAAFAGLLSSRVTIRTPTAVCAVRGTVFEIGADDAGTDVAMAEGVLEVTDKQGKEAVLTSEETMRIGEYGLERPRMLGLADARALPAVRPYAVHQEMARDATRKLLEDLRNRELKGVQAQLGKDAVDAFGRRVRLEEYLLRPDPKSFEVLFLNARAGSFNWGHLLESFNSAIPSDLSQVPAIIASGIMSPTQPSNWLKSFEFYATNTLDANKETIAFGDPAQINFAGYHNGVQTLLWYPSTVDFTQTLSGPGVPGGSRVEFFQHQDWNVTNPGYFTWVQSVQAVAGSNALVPILGVALNPADPNPADPSSAPNGGQIIYGGPSLGGLGTALYNATITKDTLPGGPGKADLLQTTTYPDGSTVSVEKFLVGSDGTVLSFADATAGVFNQNGSYNLEVNIQSNLFQGRQIDVLIAPEILNQKQQDAPGPGGFTP